jgi:hypothetical protein
MKVVLHQFEQDFQASFRRQRAVIRLVGPIGLFMRLKDGYPLFHTNHLLQVGILYQNPYAS